MTAVVTGGGGALGGAIAARLASVGLSIAVVDLDIGRAEDVARTIEAAGGVARAYGCDLRSADAIDDVIAVSTRPAR